MVFGINIKRIWDAITARIPYTGATANVDLGENSLTATGGARINGGLTTDSATLVNVYVLDGDGQTTATINQAGLSWTAWTIDSSGNFSGNAATANTANTANIANTAIVSDYSLKEAEDLRQGNYLFHDEFNGEGASTQLIYVGILNGKPYWKYNFGMGKFLYYFVKDNAWFISSDTTNPEQGIAYKVNYDGTYQDGNGYFTLSNAEPDGTYVGHGTYAGCVPVLFFQPPKSSGFSGYRNGLLTSYYAYLNDNGGNWSWSITAPNGPINLNGNSTGVQGGDNGEFVAYWDSGNFTNGTWAISNDGNAQVLSIQTDTWMSADGDRQLSWGDALVFNKFSNGNNWSITDDGLFSGGVSILIDSSFTYSVSVGLDGTLSNGVWQITNDGIGNGLYTSGIVDTYANYYVIVDESGNLSNSVWVLHNSGKANFTQLNLSNLPTSATGLSAGDVWRDGTTLKIVI